MSDFISRQAAIDVVRKCNVKEVTPAYMLIDKAEAMTELMMLPSAEPEIIRCKDCKWYELPSHKITENCVKWMKSNGILLPIEPNDFCSYAERRTDE